jgi:hypothetical protein
MQFTPIIQSALSNSLCPKELTRITNLRLFRCPAQLPVRQGDVTRGISSRRRVVHVKLQGATHRASRQPSKSRSAGSLDGRARGPRAKDPGRPRLAQLAGSCHRQISDPTLRSGGSSTARSEVPRSTQFIEIKMVAPMNRHSDRARNAFAPGRLHPVIALSVKRPKTCRRVPLVVP